MFSIYNFISLKSLRRDSSICLKYWHDLDIEWEIKKKPTSLSQKVLFVCIIALWNTWRNLCIQIHTCEFILYYITNRAHNVRLHVNFTLERRIISIRGVNQKTILQVFLTCIKDWKEFYMKSLITDIVRYMSYHLISVITIIWKWK